MRVRQRLSEELGAAGVPSPQALIRARKGSESGFYIVIYISTENLLLGEKSKVLETIYCKIRHLSSGDEGQQSAVTGPSIAQRTTSAL